MLRKSPVVIFVFIAIFFIPDVILGEENGFNPRFKLTTNYFTLHYDSEEELARFNRNINLSASQRLLYGADYSVGQIDILFLRVSEILDMRPYNFKGKIKICRDQQQLSQIYKVLFNKDLSSPSFYVYALKTIYVSSANVDAVILGHEMAHALISNYFAVVPPVKMQEILAGYVEYQLRKDAQ